MSRKPPFRERILQAATEILADEGLSRLSIERISLRAGISRRSFFNYFPGKEELMIVVLKSLRAAHDQAMFDWSAELSESLSAEERISRIFKRIIDIISAPTWKGSAFIRLSSELAELENHPIHEIVAEAKRDQERWFERELRAGKFDAPSLLATQLTIIMTGLFQLQLVHRSPYIGESTLSLISDLLACHRAKAIRLRTSGSD